MMKQMNKRKKMIPVEFKYAKKENTLRCSPQGNCYSIFEFTQDVPLGLSLLSDC